MTLTEIYDIYLKQLRHLTQHFTDTLGRDDPVDLAGRSKLRDRIPDERLKEIEATLANMALHVAVLRGMTRGDGF